MRLGTGFLGGGLGALLTREAEKSSPLAGGLDAATAALKKFEAAAAKTADNIMMSRQDVSQWYSDTIAGDKARRTAISSMTAVGSGGPEGFEFDIEKLKKLGKGGMLKALGEMKGSYSAIYGQAGAALARKGEAPTEENIFQQRPELELMHMVMKELEKSIVGLRKGVKITNIMNVSTSPGARADSRNQDPPQPTVSLWAGVSS